MKTTIQVEKSTKKLLDQLKIHPRESYDSVIKRLILERIDTEPLSEETIKSIEKALEDIKAGRLYTTEEVKKELKLE